MLATYIASSTVDESQSASKAIYHSYLSERRGGPGPTWLSEGGWAGGGGGKMEADGVPSHKCSPPARQRRARALTGGTEERSRSEGLAVSDRGRGPCPRTAGGHGNGDGDGHGFGGVESISK